MRYNDFGQTGVKISALGFGCMRLPMVTIDGKNTVDQDKVDQMLKRGYELGINYFDTAYLYNDGQSEIAVGRAVKSFRKDILVSSKSPSHLIKKPGDYRRILEEQLKKLDMDYIDFYHFHGIRYESFLSIDKNANWLKEAQQAKEEGLIKHISFSCHDKPENMIKLIDMGCFESVLCQYSAIDRSNEEAIAYAKAKGLGTVVMGPLGGGRVSGLPKEIAQQLGLKVKSSVEMAFRFVFANSNINCALSGMENLKMVEENCEISLNGEPLSAEEVQAVNDLMAENKRLSELYCTGCAYCVPCPKGVNIPEIFKMMNYYKIYKIEDYAKGGYNNIGKYNWAPPGKQADACVDCGVCETKCPQKIKIREQLKESHRALSR